jgi:hypothetical protein
VIDIDTEFFGTMRQIAAISTKRSRVVESESCGAAYIPSSTACDAGMFAVSPKSQNSLSLLLHIGAFPAIVYCLMLISENIVCSTASSVECSMIALPCPST